MCEPDVKPACFELLLEYATDVETQAVYEQNAGIFFSRNSSRQLMRVHANGRHQLLKATG